MGGAAIGAARAASGGRPAGSTARYSPPHLSMRGSRHSSRRYSDTCRPGPPPRRRSAPAPPGSLGATALSGARLPVLAPGDGAARLARRDDARRQRGGVRCARRRRPGPRRSARAPVRRALERALGSVSHPESQTAGGAQRDRRGARDAAHRPPRLSCPPRLARTRRAPGGGRRDPRPAAQPRALGGRRLVVRPRRFAPRSPPLARSDRALARPSSGAALRRAARSPVGRLGSAAARGRAAAPPPSGCRSKCRASRTCSKCRCVPATSAPPSACASSSHSQKKEGQARINETVPVPLSKPCLSLFSRAARRAPCGAARREPGARPRARPPGAGRPSAASRRSPTGP